MPLINLGNIDNVFSKNIVGKNFGNAMDQTQGCWVQSENTIHCAMRPPNPVHHLYGYSSIFLSPTGFPLTGSHQTLKALLQGHQPPPPRAEERECVHPKEKPSNCLIIKLLLQSWLFNHIFSSKLNYPYLT